MAVLVVLARLAMSMPTSFFPKPWSTLRPRISSHSHFSSTTMIKQGTKICMPPATTMSSGADLIHFLCLCLQHRQGFC